MTPPRDDDSEGYKVGYGKPPKHSRFAPGHSGNPKGRPRGTKNLKTYFAEELSEKIVVREGEKIHRVTKLQGMVKALVHRAVKGDGKATNVVLSRVDAAEESKMFSVDEGRQFARYVIDLAMRFLPEEKHEQLLAALEELLGIEPQSRQLPASSSSNSPSPA